MAAPPPPAAAVVPPLPAPQAEEEELPQAAPPPPPPPAALAAPPAAVEEAAPAVSRFRLGLRKTRDSFLGRLRAVVGGGAKAEEIYEGLEEALIGADVGVEASTKLVEAVRTKLKNNATADGIREALKEEITAMLTKVERQPGGFR